MYSCAIMWIDFSAIIHTTVYGTVHFLIELFLLFIKNYVKNILIKDAYKSQNITFSIAIDFFKTKCWCSVWIQRKDCLLFFFPEKLVIRWLYNIILFIFHNYISNPCTGNMWTSLKWHKFYFREQGCLSVWCTYTLF